VVAFFKEQFELAASLNHSSPADHQKVPPPPSTTTPPFRAGVDYFVMGENRWHFSPQWPVYTRRMVFYLSFSSASTSSLSSSSKQLSRFSSPHESTACHLEYQLTPTLAHLSGGHTLVHVARQQSLRGHSRWHATVKVHDTITYHGWQDANHVIFTTEALEGPLRVVGTPFVTLFLSSSDENADLFCYLVAYDVVTDKVSYVTEGHFRASHRKEVMDDHENAHDHVHTDKDARDVRTRDEIQCLHARDLKKDAKKIATTTNTANDVKNAVSSSSSSSFLPPLPDPSVPFHSFHSADERPVKGLVRVRFGLMPLAYQFAPGASLQLRVAGCDPRHFITPSTPRQLTIFSSPIQVSSLSVPVVDLLEA
jgi:predicted acyl esterase